MTIWQIVDCSMRRISFRNSIWRAGDSADSGSSKLKMPCRWQRASKKRRRPSPWEWERKSGSGAPTSRAASSRYLAIEKKLSARKNQPLVIFGSQPARSASESSPPITSVALEMIDRHVPLAAAGFVISGEHGYSFQQRGLAGAVLADDDGDRPIKTQLEIVVQERKAERIGRAVGDARRLEPDAPEIRRRHIDGSISS